METKRFTIINPEGEATWEATPSQLWQAMMDGHTVVLDTMMVGSKWTDPDGFVWTRVE